MNHAMIDTETLSLNPDATVISIGVAIFNDEQVIDSAGWAIKPDYWHGHIDPSTIAWWAHPDRDGARDFSFSGNMTDFGVAFQLKTFLAQHNAQEMWANDPEFDMVVLKQWWHRIGKEPVGGQLQPNPGAYPLPYKMSRSYRTINAEAQRLGHDTRQFWADSVIAHNPVDDAVSQARVVVGARKLIGGINA